MEEAAQVKPSDVDSLVELTGRLREIGHGSSPTEVAQVAVRTARWALQAEISWCGFRHGDALVMGAYENLHPRMADVWRLPLGHGIGGRVAATGTTLRADDYRHDPRRVPVLKSLIDDAGVRGAVCAPVTGDGVVFGVLYVADRRPRAFSDQEAELATLIAACAGDALSRLDREATVEAQVAQFEREIVHSRAAREDLLEVADALADANDVVAGLRFLASRLGVEVRLHDQFGNLLRKAGDVLGDTQLRVPLTADPSELGQFEVIADAPLEKGAAELIHQTARLIVLQILRERSGLEAELQLHSQFFSGLLAGTLDDDEEGLLRRASLLGLDLREPMVVICIGVHQGSTRSPAARTPPTRLMRQAVERAAREQFHRPVVSLRSEEVVVVAEVGERDHASLHEHVAELVQRASRARGTELSAGIGRICTGLSDYPEAYYQAAMALSLAVQRPAPRALVTPADLGLYGLFGHGASRQSLQSIVEQALGPLIEADARTGSEYVKTLDAFLANDRHLERTAKALHVHVNTVRYRLNKIREISAVDLHDVESRFLVELALRARAALPQPGDQPPPAHETPFQQPH
jgi:sugar diacid utilization regulator/putative methionine-R-sulfoxide reductase with GAF domain